MQGCVLLYLLSYQIKWECSWCSLLVTWHWKIVFFHSSWSHSILQPALWSGQSRVCGAYLHATQEWSLWITLFTFCVSPSIARLETVALCSLLASNCKGVHGNYLLDLMCWVGSKDGLSLFCFFQLYSSMDQSLLLSWGGSWQRMHAGVLGALLPGIKIGRLRNGLKWGIRIASHVACSVHTWP